MTNSPEQIDTVISDVGGVILMPSGTSLFLDWIVGESGVDRDYLAKELSIRRKAITAGQITENDYFQYVSDLGIPLSADELRKVYISLLSPNAEMVTLLNELRESGLTMALLSNSIPCQTIAIRQALGGIIDIELFSNEMGSRKPNPFTWEIALEILGKDPEQCLVTDDKAVNLIAPAELGMHVEQFVSPEDFRRILREKYHLVF
jgi:HAD superfamily hydrolase (TIGR01509 family)